MLRTMKRTLSIALSLALLATACITGLVLPVAASSTPTGLLPNGDFEGTPTSGWTWDNHATNAPKYAIISEGNSLMTITNDPDGSGNKCLKIPEQLSGTTYKTYDKYYKSAPVEAGKKYRLSMKYKGTGLRVYIHTSYCTPGGVYNASAAADWTDYAVEFTVNESTTTKNFIFAIGHAAVAGTVYIDDVCLNEVTELSGVVLPEQITLSKGDTQKLSLIAEPEGAVLPNETISWTSSNTAVATVGSDGTVTAIDSGVAYITATVGGFTATTTVVVASTDNKWTDTNLLVDGDFEVETLSSNWSKFTAATANVTHTTDPADAANHCLKFTGSKVPNYTSISSAKGDTYYLFSFRHKGTGKAQASFTKNYVDVESVVVLNTEAYSISNTTNDIRMYIDTKADWQTINIVFKTTASTNKSWILQFGSYGAATELYLDDVSLIELGKATVSETVSGGSVSLSSGSASGTALTGLSEGATVTATVTPNAGYILVPGSLRYVTPDGFTKRILNKDGEFGAGDGNSFTFEKPMENVRVFADFVKTDSTDFAWGTVGTSVRYAEDGVTKDGIRFLTRVNLTAFDAAAAAGLTLKYEGETYTVKELGLMLKRAENANELTVANKDAYGMTHLPSVDRIWSVTVYTAASNTFRLTDYTENYIDYTIAMTTTNPNEAFNDRVYTARGYLILEKGGEETVLYADERTDSVNTALARENGELSDTDIVVPGTGSGGGDSGEEDEPTVTVPEDDKDYTNADLKILSIGNSYSQDAQAYLSKIATLEGKTFKTVNLYKAGCALKTHYEGWANNEAIYNYELNGTANADYNSFVSLKAVLESDQFDVITLQQSSWGSLGYSNFQPYLNNLITEIRKLQPNATIYIHQTWAYGDGHASHSATSGGTMAAMWLKVEAAYNSAAAETGLSLIPSGQAIQLAQEELNTGNYSATSIQRDNAHVSKTWGRYLLARLWYEMFTGEVPNVTINQVNASVVNDAAMEAMIQGAIADAFVEYPADPVEMEAAA